MSESDILRHCPVCGGRPRRIIETREMMFGFRDEYRYGECETCLSLWLVNPPAVMADYYPEGYYSLGHESRSATEVTGPTVLTKSRSRLLLRLPVLAIERLVLSGTIPPYYWWLSLAHARTSSRIADLGAGDGELIKRMARQGFADLWGFDPFCSGDSDEGPVHIRRGDACSISGEFDLIMMNHSLEHIRDPRETLAMARDHLAPSGAMVIRLPIADSFAAAHYGPNWVALDPPRHFFVPSKKGMSELARESGLQITKIFFDSTALQFWGSELYRRNTPLKEADEEKVTHFSQQEMFDWSQRARKLNLLGEGDNAGFVLSHAP